MADRLHLDPGHRGMLEALLREHLPEAEVWAYGSRVNGRSHDGSDLDLVLRGPGLKELQIGRLADFEEAVRNSRIPFLVEARDWAHLPTRFHREIEANYTVLLPGSRPDGTADGTAAPVVVPEEWRDLPFGKAVRINPEVPLDQGATYPFVDMATINPGSRSAFSGKQREFKGGGSRFRSGDTLMARITPCLENGKIARYKATGSGNVAHGSTEFIVIRGRSRITDNDFAYYLTRWEKVRNYAIGQMTGTSGRQRVPTASLRHLAVPVPPLPEQRAIARILGTLDDRIELNRRINETLEVLARTIFKDWFVDFGPTRAKTEGREPYLSPELWNLFPDTLDDEGKPLGWKCGTFGEYFRLTMGQSPPGSTYNDHGEGLPFFQGRKDFGLRYPENRRYCTAPARIAASDDTLVSVRAPVGDINMAWEKCCAGRGIAVLRHKSGARSFTYYSAQAMKQELEQYEQTGTVFDAINQKSFRSLRSLEPLPEIVELFEQVVGPLDDRIRNNVSENRTLVQARDLLLPKLMSGEILLCDAERLAEEIA